MKMRHGFVSNSSSTSYTVFIPASWNPTDEQILAKADYEEGQEASVIANVRKGIKTLKSGKELWSEDGDGESTYPAGFVIMELLPKRYVLSQISTGPDDSGLVVGVKKEKILNLVEEID